MFNVATNQWTGTDVPQNFGELQAQLEVCLQIAAAATVGVVFKVGLLQHLHTMRIVPAFAAFAAAAVPEEWYTNAEDISDQRLLELDQLKLQRLLASLKSQPATPEYSMKISEVT